MTDKICPLAAHGEERMHYGCIPNCAWYDAASDKCAVVIIATGEQTPKTKSAKSSKG